MASIGTVPRAEEAVIGSAPRTPRPDVVVVGIGGAWLIAILAQVTGNAGALHHHALIEGGPPLWVALVLFVVAWQVMIAAMMVPASLPAIRLFWAAVQTLAQPSVALAAFLGAYAGVWTIFGIGAFMGDVALHRAVDAMPWLGARPWLIEASVLGIAGAYQFAPLKRRTLKACRHFLTVEWVEQGAIRLGVRHGLDCLGSSWALMLLMFAAGFANLWWMAALAIAMAYETMGRRGERVASTVGVLLFGLAVFALSTGSAPAFGAT